jgi:hypothetical protein
MIGKGNRSTRRKPAPVPLCAPQTLHTARTRTRAAAVGSQRLTDELRHGLKQCTNYIYSLSDDEFIRPEHALEGTRNNIAHTSLRTRQEVAPARHPRELNYQIIN